MSTGYLKGPGGPPPNEDLSEGIKNQSNAVTSGINSLANLHKTSAVEMAKTMQAFDSLQQATLQGALIAQGQIPTTVDEQGNVQMANITTGTSLKPQPAPSSKEPLVWSQVGGIAVNAGIQIYTQLSGHPMDPVLASSIAVVVQGAAALIARQFVSPVK